MSFKKLSGVKKLTVGEMSDAGHGIVKNIKGEKVKGGIFAFFSVVGYCMDWCMIDRSEGYQYTADINFDAGYTT